MDAEVVTAWVAAADDDLRAVENNLHGPKPTIRAAAYHCQQAAEKLIKAVLVSIDRHPPRTHDVGALLDLVSAGHRLLPILTPLTFLSPYAWLFRYPPGAPTEVPEEPDRADVERWLVDLQAVRQAVTDQLAPD